MKSKAAIACAMFMVCSATMALVNKLVVIRFKTPVTVLGLQNAFCVGVLWSVFRSSLHFGSARDVKRWCKIVPFLFAGMLISSIYAQLYASMGLQIVIRNLGPLVSLPVERVFNEPIVTDRWTWSSLVFILFGVSIYVAGSVGSQSSTTLAAGIALMVVNLFFGVAERLYQRKLIAVEPVDISKTGLLLLNNAGAIVPVTVLIFSPGML